MADEAGIDFLLPIGRWKGYGGDTGYQEATLEPSPGPAGCWLRQKRITVFGTVHAPLFHPVIAAKQMVTADHIGEGRFGTQHRGRLERGRIRDVRRRAARARPHAMSMRRNGSSAIKLMWSAPDDFDFDGAFIKLKNVAPSPSPMAAPQPVIMNAGARRSGRAFAVRNCDAFFMQSSRTSVAETAQRWPARRPKPWRSAAPSACSRSASSPAGRP
jgi:alkanesulfonate monooxygenase SsuD/methylene tetrahydromethanopterin reductase-like flavin-dependent oxidoreductase (luciferase family)